MKIVYERPPNHDRIHAVFPKPATGAVFYCYGEFIFNPDKVNIPKQLIEHEKVHSERQLAFPGGVELWWERYLIHDTFRFDEELAAHRAEYRAYCKRHKGGQIRYLQVVAERLASPLYGRVVNKTEAIKRILEP